MQKQRRFPGMGYTLPNRGLTDVWLTPPEIIKALGPFDLDPCAAIDQPWRTATEQYTEQDDGLGKAWHGRVWCNPPYGPETGIWLSKLAEHGNGIALIFARTETRMFFEYAWIRASAMLFVRERLIFHRPDGQKAEMNAGGPSVLIAYGALNAVILKGSGIAGALVEQWEVIPAH